MASGPVLFALKNKNENNLLEEEGEGLGRRQQVNVSSCKKRLEISH